MTTSKKRPTKLLVICHGNINRSPLATALLRSYLPSRYEVDGAGFVNPGKRATLKMRDASSELGVSLEAHRSKLVSKELLQWADLVVYMDGGNLKRLNAACDEHGVHPESYCLAHSVKKTRVPDPAFIARGTQEFHDVVLLIDQASKALAEELIAADRAAKDN